MKIFVGFLLVAALTGLDQVSKYLVVEYLPFQQSVGVVPFFSLFHTYNFGVAFSWLSFVDNNILMMVITLVIGFVLWLWSQVEAGRLLSHLGFGFIIAGALGNLVDRFILGYVVDFIQVHTQTWSFAIFNLADVFIFIGAVLIILDEFRQARETRSEIENE